MKFTYEMFGLIIISILLSFWSAIQSMTLCSTAAADLWPKLLQKNLKEKKKEINRKTKETYMWFSLLHDLIGCLLQLSAMCIEINLTGKLLKVAYL